MRKKDENLRESLLDSARKIALKEGVDAINIRRLASDAGIATGTVYNYFLSKEDVLLALTEEYWRKALGEIQSTIHSGSFPQQIADIYLFLGHHISDSVGILMNSLGNVKGLGIERMKTMQAVLRNDILQRMQNDANIRRDIWNEQFSKEEYADFVLMNMLTLLQTNSHIDFFLKIVRQTLY